MSARLVSHNQLGENTFTSKHRPWELVALFSVEGTESFVMRLEKFIKKQKSRSLIEKLIDPAFIPNGNLAQLVRVPHVRD